LPVLFTYKNISMKKLFIFLTVIMLFAACSQAPTYKVTGELTSIDGTVYLTHRVVKDKWENIDSTDLVEGKFTFNGTVKGPEQYLLTFKNTRGFVPFILENAAINIKADLNNPEATKITGSASQDVMTKYGEAMKVFQEQEMELQKAYGSAAQANDEAKIKKIITNYKELQEEKVVASKNFIRNNNKSFASALIASKMIQGKEAKEIDAIIALLDASLLEIDMVVDMKKKADVLRKVAIGQIAPDFTMNDTKDNPVKLSSLYGKGYILVDFWASWCGPCRGENPNVVAAYNKYHAKGFEILGVSYDDNKDKWLKAIEEDKLPWIHVSDLKGWGNITAKLYSISGIPSNVLLDKEGKIVAKNLRGDDLKEKLAELLK
jgi:peroxiredoxin